MTTMVRFQVGDGEYAIPVDHVREVRSGERLSALPSSRDGVVGLLRDGGDALAVLDALGPGRDHVLLLQHGDRRFGLAVAAVTSVVDLAAAPGPPPDGQVGHLLSGVIEADDGLVLLVDVGALLEILDTAAPPAGWAEPASESASESDEPGDVPGDEPADARVTAGSGPALPVGASV